jgi:hypothetical protein
MSVNASVAQKYIIIIVFVNVSNDAEAILFSELEAKGPK